MGFKEDYPGLNTVLDEFFETAGDVKLGLKDGKFTVDDAVNSIPDDAVQNYVRTMFTSLQRLPGEIKKVVDGGPWEMMKLFPVLAEKGKILFK